MTDPIITIDEAPDPALREHILRPLLEYNHTQVGERPLKTLALFLRDADSNDIIGGLWARTFYDWCFVENLFVPEKLRGKGIGRSLLQKTEAIAMERKCVGIWLDTFSFQAQDFYEKLGYKVFAEIPDYPDHHVRYLLRKRLGHRALE